MAMGVEMDSNLLLKEDFERFYKFHLAGEPVDVSGKGAGIPRRDSDDLRATVEDRVLGHALP